MEPDPESGIRFTLSIFLLNFFDPCDPYRRSYGVTDRANRTVMSLLLNILDRFVPPLNRPYWPQLCQKNKEKKF